jgi:hypothetical protein
VIRASARGVEKIFKLAEGEALEVRHQADAAAAALLDQACAEAEQLVAQARAEAGRLVAAATDAAQKRERSSAHELHQLSRLREEINADLYRAKEVLDSLFGATGAISGVISGTRAGAGSGSILGRNLKDGAKPPHPARTV